MQIADNPVAFNLINDDWPGNFYEDKHELVTYKNNTTLRIWYNHQTHGYSAHWHTALEIILPVENYYDVSSDQANFHILPGEILVIPPGEMHTLIAPDSGNRFVFLFDMSFINGIKGFSGIRAMMHGPIYITPETFPKSHSVLHNILLQMTEEYFSESEFAELSITSLLLKFFVLLGKDYRLARNPFPDIQAPKQKTYIQKFSSLLGYIDLHYAENLTLEDMASYAGFSKFHFSRLFKQYTKDTFSDYLNRRRIRAAEELLAAPPPDTSITEIAMRCGFASISTFNRLFKQIKNCTPGEFRALNRVEFL